MKRKILITGGCGFIGSHFIRHIIKKYPRDVVINLDKLTYAGNPKNLEDIKGHRGYFFYKGDICDHGVLQRIYRAHKNIDVLVNFAAESHVDRSIVDPDDFLRANIFGVKTLLEFARDKKIKRFLQISTDEVYGSRETGSFTEESPLLPNSPYAASKAAADLLARSYHVTHGLPVLITRSSNNFGPCQFPEKVIPLFITNLLKNKKVPVYGRGLNVRDWLYVEDNCAAIDLVLSKGKAGEIYNIGGGQEIANIELTWMILAHMKKSPSHIQFVKDRLGHDFRYSVRSHKVKKLGWWPRHDFEQSLIHTIEWYCSHATWWGK